MKDMCVATNSSHNINLIKAIASVFQSPFIPLRNVLHIAIVNLCFLFSLNNLIVLCTCRYCKQGRFSRGISYMHHMHFVYQQKYFVVLHPNVYTCKPVYKFHDCHMIHVKQHSLFMVIYISKWLIKCRRY